MNVKPTLLPSVLLAALTLVVIAFSPTSAPAAEACPNGAVRGESHSLRLPDCRAYEQISPVDKNGWWVRLRSADSSHALLESLGVFAGSGQQGTITNLYQSERTQGGWTTSPLGELTELTPVGEGLMVESSDLTTGLLQAESSSTAALPSERNFYVRAIPGGGPEEIGPAISLAARIIAAGVPNPSYGPLISLQGASDHLASMLFAIKGPGPINGGLNYLWPGDTTVENTGPLDGGLGFESLYEYRGRGKSSPLLVGTNSGDLISQCGISLGLPSNHAFVIGAGIDELYNALSESGSRVFFTAAAARQGPSGDACTGAGAGSGPHVDELYARVGGSQTVAISQPSSEDCAACDTTEAAQQAAPEGAQFQGASKDGSKVFFLSEQHLLAGAESQNLYRFDFNAEAGQRVTLIAPDVLGVSRVSQDGSHVYFVSESKLTAAPNPVGAVATPGADNLYLHTDAGTAFVGTLSAADKADWQLKDRRPVAATPDGRFLVFTSSAQLTPDDHSSVPQVFRYDAQAATLVRVSAGREGFNNDGNTSQYPATIINPEFADSENPAPKPGSVSDDGAYVVFQSSDQLTPQAATGYPNVYEYHAGQVSLISDGQDRSVDAGGVPLMELIGIDGSGQDIFFTTAAQLVPQDGDTQADVYDARIGGGFPAPPAPPACQGDACQGALAPAPLFSSPASLTQPAGGQVPEPAQPTTKPKLKSKSKPKPKRCKKGKTLKHGRCVKQKATKSNRRNR